MSLHRDMPPIPTDPAARRVRIEWICEHRIWTHPYEWRLPPSASEWERGLADSDGFIRGTEGGWSECVDIEIAHVDPSTERIEDDPLRNTAFRVWLEAGPWHDGATDDPPMAFDSPDRWGASHDFRLDCGGPGLETALLELARRVEFYYCDDGTDRTDAPEECGDSCEYDAAGFCAECGFACSNYPWTLAARKAACT